MSSSVGLVKWWFKDKFDIVSGHRINRQDQKYRIILTYLFNLFLRIPKQVYAIEQIKNLKYSAVFSTFSNNKCIFDQKRIYLITVLQYYS